MALGLWQASEAIWGYRNREGAKRAHKQVASGARAIIYAALGVSAASFALGSGSSSSQSQQQATSGVLAWPGGRVIVVVAGLIIIAVGAAHVVKGVKKSFAEEIDTSSMSAGAREGVARLGQIGYIRVTRCPQWRACPPPSIACASPRGRRGITSSLRVRGAGLAVPSNRLEEVSTRASCDGGANGRVEAVATDRLG